MTDDGSSDGPISRKELARQLRRHAYQRAKALREADPAYIAMKESMKQRRKEQYQLAKTRKKSADAAARSKRKLAQGELRQEERKASDAQLFALLTFASAGSKMAN